MALGMEVGLGPGHIVLDGEPAPLPKKGQSPQFSAHFYCHQTAGWIKMALGMEVGLGPGDFVSDGDRATPRTEGTPTTTQFLAHVYCGQTAGWMKTPLGTEVDLGPCHIVLDGSQLSVRQAYRSGVKFFNFAKPSIYYRKGQWSSHPKIDFFVQLTISAVEASKVKQI